MTVFLDTSGLLAVLNPQDLWHEAAAAVWEDLVLQERPMVSSNYVLVETTALLQSRSGIEAVREFFGSIVPQVQVEWVDSEAHARAVEMVLTAARRELSLVDCTSFGLMRRLGLTTAFAIDRHFLEQGFRCLPESPSRDPDRPSPSGPGPL